MSASASTTASATASVSKSTTASATASTTAAPTTSQACYSETAYYTADLPPGAFQEVAGTLFQPEGVYALAEENDDGVVLQQLADALLYIEATTKRAMPGVQSSLKDASEYIQRRLAGLGLGEAVDMIWVIPQSGVGCWMDENRHVVVYNSVVIARRFTVIAFLKKERPRCRLNTALPTMHVDTSNN